MTEQEKNDLYYVCTLIEAIGRRTNNHRSDVVKSLGTSGISLLLRDASVNHCLSLEQVSDEMTELYHIQNGVYDTLTSAKYSVPSVTSIGKVYTRLITAVRKPDETIEKALYEVFTSFISDAISDFNSSVYYSNPDYLKHSYLDGRLLD